MPESQLQQFGLVVIIGGPILASCVVGLRVFARRKFGIRLGWGESRYIQKNVDTRAFKQRD
jgi:hypothetical protein